MRLDDQAKKFIVDRNVPLCYSEEIHSPLHNYHHEKLHLKPSVALPLFSIYTSYAIFILFS